MGGVWIFNDGISQLVENPLAVPMNENNTTGVKGKVLVHLATNQEVTSYETLDQKLREAGWTRFWDGDDSLRQYHKSDCCNNLISLPKSFAHMKSMHMYDIVVKNPHTFRVRDK